MVILGILNTYSRIRSKSIKSPTQETLFMKTKLSTPAFSHHPTISHAGFSLVEVVLAVGIMALGVVTILGLLPHGMEMSRKTANEQAETRIVDQMVGELQASDWDTMGGVVAVTSGNGVIRLFDDQGMEITGSSADIAESLTYVARVSVQFPNEKGAGTPRASGVIYIPAVGAGMPMSSNKGAVLNNYIRRVRIEVATSPDPAFNFDNPPPAIAVKSFSQLVAKTGW